MVTENIINAIIVEFLYGDTFCRERLIGEILVENMIDCIVIKCLKLMVEVMCH